MVEWTYWMDYPLWEIYQPIIEDWETPENTELEAYFLPGDERPCRWCGRDQDDPNTCYNGVHVAGYKHPVFAHLEVTETDPETGLQATYRWGLSRSEIISKVTAEDPISPPQWLSDLFEELRIRPYDEICEECVYPERPSPWLCVECGHPLNPYSYWPEVFEELQQAFATGVEA